MSTIIHIKPMEHAVARAICGWRYKPPYDIYNVSDGTNDDALIAFFTDPLNAYYSLTDPQDNLVGFCCFGHDAQVPGGDYTSDALDIGMGIRPDLTGQRRGYDFVVAVVGFAQQTFPATRYRVTIAEFNERARRVWERARFEIVQYFTSSTAGRSFIVMTKEVTHG